MHSDESGHRLDGHTAAVQDGREWVVRYSMCLDENWITTSGHVWCWSSSGDREVRIDTDGAGHWNVNGAPAPEYHGCFDLDLESSACTNAVPVHRLELGVGQSAEAPAVFVRAADLGIERLEQHYLRMDGDGTRQRYGYRAPAFGFESELLYDESGLVLEYPGLAVRVL